MTYLDYLEHPMGKGSSMGSRLYRTELLKQYNTYIADKFRISYECIKYKGRYYYISRVESRSLKGFFYDVVLEFTSSQTSASLKIDNTYNMRVFSNAPSFNFTYVYTFNKKDMLISELRNKYSKIALVDSPDIKNPNNIVNYDRILFFSIISMLRNKATDTTIYKEGDLKSYVTKIDTADNVLSKYTREKKIREVNDKRAKDRDVKTRESTKSKPVLSSHKKDDNTKRDHVKSKVTGKSPKKPKAKR